MKFLYNWPLLQKFYTWTAKWNANCIEQQWRSLKGLVVFKATTFIKMSGKLLLERCRCAWENLTMMANRYAVNWEWEIFWISYSAMSVKICWLRKFPYLLYRGIALDVTCKKRHFRAPYWQAAINVNSCCVGWANRSGRGRRFYFSKFPKLSLNCVHLSSWTYIIQRGTRWIK